MATSTTSGGNRVRGLDGSRALAVGLVVAAHATSHLDGGGVGVCVFFVLSGYLITGLLTKESLQTGSIHLLMFYARRALRLWPALLVMLAVTILLGAPASSALIAGTYTTDLFNSFGHGAHPYDHTWSLAVEEQFYLLWPLLLPLALRAPRRAALALTAGVVASVLGCWVWTLHSLHSSDAIGLGVFNPLWQAHGLLIGCILALVGDRFRFARPGAVAVIGGLVVVASAVGASQTVSHHWAVWWNLMVELDTMAVIIALRELSTGPFTWGPVVWMGQRSYAIYLWHLPLIRLAHEHNLPHAAALAVACAFAAAELSFRVVEAPFLRLKERLHPTAAGPPVDAVPPTK